MQISFGAKALTNLEEAGEVGARLEGLEPGVPNGAMPLGDDIIVGNRSVLQLGLQLLPEEKQCTFSHTEMIQHMQALTDSL